MTILGAYTFPNLMPEAEAQGLQLRVSAAEFPQYENHFFGPNIVEIVIDDPGATDNDESTVGLQVRGETVPRVHLSDGLWYQYTAEEDFFGIYLDLMTDGFRDNRIAVVTTDISLTPFRIGAETYDVDGGVNTFIRELTRGPGGFPFIEVQQNTIAGTARGLFPTIPVPFFEISIAVLNPDLELSTKPAATVGTLDGLCTTDEFDLPNTDCDWPYVRVVPLNQREQLVIRAGSASTILTFDEFPESITSSLNRASYPKESEIFYKFNDFQFNNNPQEVDQLFFVLDRETGSPRQVLNSPKGGITKQNILPIYPDLDYDERQILELDPEGIQAIDWIFAFSQSLGFEVNFVPDSPPFILVAENARLVEEFDDVDFVFRPGSAVPIDITAAQPGDLLPVIRINEASAKPNSGSFNTGQAGKGSRTTIFAGERDRVASFDYYDIISSAPMATHDGFTSVDREVYDSADRAVFTVTDPDQNLRSAVSESPDGRDSKNLIEIGDPIPLVNTRTDPQKSPTGIFNTNTNNVFQVWEAIFLAAGDGTIDADDLTFGVDLVGANVLVDLNNDGIIDIDTGVGGGTERFHAAEDDIVAATLDDAEDLTVDNDKFAIEWTPDLIGLDNPNAIIIDSSVTVDDIDDVITGRVTKAEIINQVRVDNLGDGNLGLDVLDDQAENFLVQVAKITDVATGDLIGRDVVLGTLADDDEVDVELPRYNLLHVDVTRLLTTSGIVDITAKIDIIDSSVAPACSSDRLTVTSEAFATDCVLASQIVDFEVKEFDTVAGDGPNRDTDGDVDTGDVYDVVIAGVNDSPWDPLSPDGLETGFDRDPSSTRIAIGPFRITDLKEAADLEDDGEINDSVLTDTIRVTIMLSDGQTIPEPDEIIQAVNQIILVDIAGLGIFFDPAPTNDEPDNIGARPGVFSNLAYRISLDEEGSNSSIFSGRADFMTFTQFDTVSDVLVKIVLTGDPVKMFLPQRFIPPNRLAFTYFDSDIIEFFREVSATFIYETRDGAIEWDRGSYSFGQDAFLTIKDEDLNERPDSQERFDLPLDAFVFFELAKQRVCSETDPAVSGDADPDTAGVQACVPGTPGAFINNVDATLLETGANTGTFVAQITMPRSILIDVTPGSPGTPPTLLNTQQNDLEANYIPLVMWFLIEQHTHQVP
jgi:hypothetical protein